MYRSFKDWITQAAALDVSMASIVLQGEVESTEKSEEEVYTELAARWLVMRTSAEKTLETPSRFAHSLISGQAAAQQGYAQRGSTLAGETVNRAMAMAFSGSEVNASMGRICAAPTAGACGVLPAVVITAAEATRAQEIEILDALLVASGVGGLITENATVSGAEGGCQAECGTAAAMGAAAAVHMAGGTRQMVCNAVSIALMNCMGLVCDPVAGLVQLPCSFRNASQAANALISADMALAGQNAVIPADEVVEAMYRVGKKLPQELRETALGGVAATPTAKEIYQNLQNGGL